MLVVQPRFRSMWERYCRGVQAIVYVVDAADHDNLDSARLELAELLGKPSLQGIPLLVLGNKNDLPGALSTTDLIDRLDLKVGPSSSPPWGYSLLLSSFLCVLCTVQQARGYFVSIIFDCSRHQVIQGRTALNFLGHCSMQRRCLAFSL